MLTNQVNNLNLFLSGLSLNQFSYLTPSLRGFKINQATLSKAGAVVQEILPLLNLYQPCAKFVAMGGGTLQIIGHLNQIREESLNGNYAECGRAVFQIGISVAILAGSLLQSRVSAIGVAAYEVAVDVHHLGGCLLHQKFDQETAEALFLTVRHVIHFTSVILPTPQMILISLIAQILFEGSEVFKELCQVSQGKEHLLKAAVKLILIGFHVYQANTQVRLLLPEKPGTGEEIPSEITKEEQVLQDLFKAFHLYQEENPNQSLSLEKFLEKNHHSTELKEINLTKISSGLISESPFFKGMNFSGISFIHCSFEGLNLQDTYFKGSLINCNLQKTTLQGASFIGCQIDHCDFQFSNLNSSFFLNTRIEYSNFNACSFVEASFYGVQLFSSFFQKIKGDQAKFFYSKFEECDLEKASFKSAQITGCDFNRTVAKQASFLRANIRASQMQKCDFSETIFKGAILTNLTTRETNFSDAVFNYAKLDHVTFEGNLNYVSFHDADFSRVYIKQSSLLGTSFLNASVKESCIQNSDLTDCLLFDTKDIFQLSGCKDPIITRPIVGLPWNLEVPGFTVPKVYRSIKEFQGIPLRLDYLPDDIDPVKLEREMQEEIRWASLRMRWTKGSSIPAEVMKAARPGSEIYKIKQRAQFYMERVGAIILPGGNNVESEFYGGVRSPDKSLYEPDLRRTTFEFALLDQAIKEDIPVVGICRGHQLTHVYLGGTLKDVEGQWGQIQEYQIKEGVIQQLMGEKVIGVSTHRQAVDRIGEGLKVVVEYDGIIKATEGTKYKIYTFQFHPEWVLDNKNISPSNGNIFIHHIKNAKDPKKKFAQMLVAAPAA